MFALYSSQLKGYRVYDLKIKYVIITRDLKFDKNKGWTWDREWFCSNHMTHLTNLKLDYEIEQW